MIIFSKIIAILLAILVITKTIYDYKKHQEVLLTMMFWIAAWICIVYISLKPDILYNLMTTSSRSGVGIGTVFGIAFIFLFFVTYRIYVKANRLEQKIKDMVMKIGIKDIE